MQIDEAQALAQFSDNHNRVGAHVANAIKFAATLQLAGQIAAAIYNEANPKTVEHNSKEIASAAVAIANAVEQKL